ncbi:GFA family protein [uncultured Phenylobacterium sp.]|uniref:GFA family protein n=1 Tax=uncultured Phenylobacterium sp. TaxID=349273 RepID=UPI0025FCD3B8|nr:GFA family protein [uncultured Phenylobacterium sp.]
MSETANGVREGGCRCGQVRFRITTPEMLTLACHCRGCQRMTGAPYSVTMIVPGGGFEVTAGEPVLGGLHGEVKHYHCPHCLSWVYTIPPVPMPMVNVRATMLDDVSGFAPYAETYTDEMLPWAKTPAKRSFPRFPADEAWPQLIREYMQSGGG